MTPASREQPADSRQVSLLLGLLFGFAGMGSASAAIAVPLIAAEFDVSAGNATWTITLYALMLGVSTAIYGRVSDLVGVRLPLLVGVGLMTAGAVLAALAPTFGVLLVARMVQGAGAAAVPTLGVTIINSRYHGSARSLALGRLAAVAAALSCSGPLLGGVVEAAVGWRAVMALPILGLLLLPVVWHALGAEGTGARLDLLGAALVALTAAGAVLLVQSPSTGVVVAVAGGLLVLLGAPATVARVRRRPHGFLPMAVVRNGTVVRSAVAAMSVPAGWFALLVGVPAVLVGAGWEPYQVGLLLMPSAGIALLVPRVAGPLIDRLGAPRALAISGVVTTAALLVAAVGAAQVWPALLGLSVLLVTVAFGVGQPAMTAAVADAVEPDVRGVALGIATLMFLVGGSVGSAVVGGVGDALGTHWSLVVLAALPLAGMSVLVPELRRGRRAAASR